METRCGMDLTTTFARELFMTAMVEQIGVNMVEDDAAAAGAVTTSESSMAYVKQLVGGYNPLECEDPIDRALTKRYEAGRSFDLGLRNKPNPYAHQDCSTKLLWGELGWLLCDITAYDDKFLTIADEVSEGEYDRSAIVSLLEEIESDGYEVNWESCVEAKTEKQSLWMRMKLKVLKWINHLIGDCEGDK